MNKTRQYELVYIVSPETSEQTVVDLHGQIEAAVVRFGCAIEKSDNWGRRKLAYSIGPHREGIYLLDVINGSGELMKEIERRLRVNEQVLVAAGYPKLHAALHQLGYSTVALDMSEFQKMDGGLSCLSLRF